MSIDESHLISSAISIINSSQLNSRRKNYGRQLARTDINFALLVIHPNKTYPTNWIDVLNAKFEEDRSCWQDVKDLFTSPCHS